MKQQPFLFTSIICFRWTHYGTIVTDSIRNLILENVILFQDELLFYFPKLGSHKTCLSLLVYRAGPFDTKGAESHGQSRESF